MTSLAGIRTEEVNEMSSDRNKETGDDECRSCSNARPLDIA